MAGRQFAVIVGVDSPGKRGRIPALSFAEADAQAMHAALTDPVTGTFDRADAVLLLGAQATAAEVKKALRARLEESSPADLLLFYFAGHGHVPLAPPQDDPFLVTSDLDFTAIGGEPDSGLRMSFLRRDVFDVFRGSSCLILDCCHAGRYEDRRSDGDRPDASTLPVIQDVVERLYMGTARLEGAVYACPADGSTRESKEAGHGLLTSAILTGLGGAAGQSGSITFHDLVSFLGTCNLPTAPGYAARGWGRGAVLTRPGGPAHGRPEPSGLGPEDYRIEPSGNPLDGALSGLEKLLDGLYRGIERKPPFTASEPEAVLEWLRRAVQAQGVARVSTADDHFEVVAETGRIRREDVLGLATRLRAKIEAEARSGSSVVGYLASPPSGGPRLLAVADSRRRPADIRVFSDVPAGLLDLGEPLPMALAAAVSSAGHLALDAEIEVITALRRRFGRLPVPLYDRCLSAYRDALHSVVIVFEPVISLSTVGQHVGIHSWEALARRTVDARSAPFWLLEAGGHWGDQFVVERDRILAMNAISAYTVAHNEGPGRRDSPRPLSLNVSVRSLLNEGYVTALHAALRDGGLSPHTVTLEISEQDPIEPHPGVDTDWAPNPNKYFQDQLRSIARRLQVNFAIDDFGVGHASLDRIASLEVTQVKIDRVVLSHPLAVDEIDLVIKLAQDAPFTGTVSNQRTVVVEGYDDACPVPLHKLYEHGVRYVQGYISKVPASPKLNFLDAEHRDHIAALVRGPDADR